jgi:hypothetical protein
LIYCLVDVVAITVAIVVKWLLLLLLLILRCCQLVFSIAALAVIDFIVIFVSDAVKWQRLTSSHTHCFAI